MFNFFLIFHQKKKRENILLFENSIIFYYINNFLFSNSRRIKHPTILEQEYFPIHTCRSFTMHKGIAPL